YDSNGDLIRIKLYVTKNIKIILMGFCPNNHSNEKGRINSNCLAINLNRLSNKQRTKLNVKFSKGVIVFTKNDIMDPEVGGSRKSFSENIVSLTEYFMNRFIPKLHNSLKYNHEFITQKQISTFYVLGPLGSFSHELAQEICEILNIDIETI
ncbi:22696_t:CDS:2, partial [Racocetra persica]